MHSNSSERLEVKFKTLTQELCAFPWRYALFETIHKWRYWNWEKKQWRPERRPVQANA